MAKFKSLKEVLLSHNGADGGLDREPGRIELLDYENRKPSPELEDGGDGEVEYIHPQDLLPLERAERDLRDFRNKNVTPEEERRVPEVKLVVAKRILNVPPYVNTTPSPYVSMVFKSYVSLSDIRFLDGG